MLQDMEMLQEQGQDVAGAGHRVLQEMECCRTWGAAGHGNVAGTRIVCGRCRKWRCCRDKDRMWPVQAMRMLQGQGQDVAGAGHGVLQTMGVLQTRLPWSAIISTVRTAHWWPTDVRSDKSVATPTCLKGLAAEMSEFYLSY